METNFHENPESRVDKWMWAVRLFKTRNQSAEACRKGRVLIGDLPVKPSRILKVGDIIRVRRPPSVYTYMVKKMVHMRQPAKMVDHFLEDLTADEEKKKSVHPNLLVFAGRDRGAGRPTKRERRSIDKLYDSF